MDGHWGNAGNAEIDTFGDRLRAAREAISLSQEELATRAGLSANAISGLERGVHRHPFPSTVRALADALGLTDIERANLAGTIPRRRSRGPETVIRPDLPTPLGSLVGREREVAEVCSRLRRDDVRLVTLTGPGGVGKTRLALHIAAALEGEFADGVAFVSLAAVRDASLVIPTIAHDLGLVEGGSRPPIDRLIDSLQHRQLLLTLDNVEHVVEAAPLIAHLLIRCPSLTVLATSRVVLHLDGERTYPVPPLAVPEPDRRMSVEQIQVVAAVQLFVARARDADPTFTLTAINASAVAAVCHRLDGLPLAIELAAARSTLFAPEAMLPRLARRLPLLAGGRRDAPARHRTMRDAISWSYDLLAEMDQRLFRRLAVFVGGFSLAMVDAVTGGDEDEVFSGVGTLIDHHLISRVEGLDGEPRFTMLETVREFADERLAESGEEQTIRMCHAAHFLEMAEEVEPALTGPDQITWFAMLEVELANLRAALTLLRDGAEPEHGVRLATALWTFWVVRDRVPEGRQWIETFISMNEAEPTTRIKALVALGDLAERQGDYAEAAAYLDEALTRARECGDQSGEAAALRILGNVTISLGEVERHRHDDEINVDEQRSQEAELHAAVQFSKAESLLRQSLTLAQAIGDEWGVAKAKHWLAIVPLERMDSDLAMTRIEDSLTDFRRLGDYRQVCMVVGNLGAVAEQSGDLARAHTAFAESIVLAQTLGYRWWIGWCLDNMARVAAASGDLERAVRLMGAASVLWPSTGEPMRSGLRSSQADLLTIIQLALGEGETAGALKYGGELSLDEAIAEALAPLRQDSSIAAISRNDWFPTRPDVPNFSTRERDVLSLLAAKYTVQEIAEAIVVGPRVIKAHIKNILAKLGTTNQQEALERAAELGLIHVTGQASQQG